MRDFIQGERFEDLANNVNVFYRHTHDVNAFLKDCVIDVPFVLASHNSDGCVKKGSGGPSDANSDLIPDNCMHWFGQNIAVEHPRISSLPIGIENKAWESKDKKKEKMEQLMKQYKVNEQLLYINHSVSTNPAEREEPYQLFKDKSWATLVKGNHGYKFDEYLNSVYTHNFVLCPEGNGIDTHRTWEALYMGTIPIEKRNINNQFYTYLPICFVDDWKEITEEFLAKEFIRIKTSKWNMEKLNFEYWEHKILNHE
jgi:hypothetical protein